MKQKTRKQIINETFNYYNKDPQRRAVKDDRYGDVAGCMYNGPGGTHCAIGRLFKSKYRNKGDELQGNESEFVTFLEDHSRVYHHNTLSLPKMADHMLKPSYRGHLLTFWIDLQTLHDDENNWYEDKATNEGCSWKRTLHRKWDEELEVVE